jgi:hypothetical protein
MDLFGLKAKTAAKFIKNQGQNPDSEKKNPPSRIKSVGALADIDLFRNYDFTRKLIESFELAPNQVRVALVDPSGKNQNTLDAPEAFGEDSFGLYGKIKNATLEEFVEKEFDLLVNYSGTDWVFSEVILTRSKARLKAGFGADDAGWQDISIKIPGNKMDTFHEELVKYLRIMNLL